MLVVFEIYVRTLFRKNNSERYKAHGKHDDTKGLEEEAVTRHFVKRRNNLLQVLNTRTCVYVHAREHASSLSN